MCLQSKVLWLGRMWHANGLNVLKYLHVNDGIMAVQGEEEAKRTSGWVRNTLQKSPAL